MADDVTGRYAARPTIAERVQRETAKEGKEYKAFDAIAANRRQEPMLELRFKDGNSIALPYAFLVRIEWDPSDGIVLKYTSCLVRISGRHLTHLQQKLIRHDVTWLAEIDDIHATELPKDEAVVISIELQEKV